MSSYRLIEPSGPIFTFAFSAISLSTAGPADLFFFTAPSNSRVSVREVRLGQYTEFGDAQAELLPIQLMTGSTGTGAGTAIVGLNVQRHTGGPTAGSSLTGPTTTVASTASAVVNLSDSFNVAAGFYYKPDWDERIVVPPSGKFMLRVGTPNDALTLNGTIVLQEIGKPAST